MVDARYLRSRRAVKEALLVLLEKRQIAGIAMTELAREAGVSRSTLYAHVGNVQDVYAELVRDFYASLRPLGVHLHCGDCSAQSSGARPFCVALRDAGPYLFLVKDAHFLPTLFEQLESGLVEGGALSAYLVPGLSEAQARAVFRFQMSGCYAVALSDAPAEEWARVQQALDTFIRGGLNALRAG